MATEQYKYGKGKDAAEAVKIELPGGKEQAVGIKNLHVLVVPDGSGWFAQAFEIDYGVQGSTPEEAKKDSQKVWQLQSNTTSISLELSPTCSTPIRIGTYSRRRLRDLSMTIHASKCSRFLAGWPTPSHTAGSSSRQCAQLPLKILHGRSRHWRGGSRDSL